MQLCAAIHAKTAVGPRLNAFRLCSASKQLVDFPPDARFQYGNGNQFAMSRGLASVAWHLIFRDPPTSEST